FNSDDRLTEGHRLHRLSFLGLLVAGLGPLVLLGLQYLDHLKMSRPIPEKIFCFFLVYFTGLAVFQSHSEPAKVLHAVSFGHGFTSKRTEEGCSLLLLSFKPRRLAEGAVEHVHNHNSVSEGDLHIQPFGTNQFHVFISRMVHSSQGQATTITDHNGIPVGKDGLLRHIVFSLNRRFEALAYENRDSVHTSDLTGQDRRTRTHLIHVLHVFVGHEVLGVKLQTNDEPEV